jgi:hypothetical protein
MAWLVPVLLRLVLHLRLLTWRTMPLPVHVVFLLKMLWLMMKVLLLNEFLLLKKFLRIRMESLLMECLFLMINFRTNSQQRTRQRQSLGPKTCLHHIQNLRHRNLHHTHSSRYPLQRINLILQPPIRKLELLQLILPA